MKTLRLLTLAGFSAVAAFSAPVTVSFTDMVDTIGVGGEPWIPAVLHEAASFGLTITTTGAEFNVGCGSPSCLGANNILGGNDFDGDIVGVFATATPFLNMNIVNASFTDLYGEGGVFLGTFAGDFAYAGVAVKSFVFKSSFDAIWDLEFDSEPALVPEPATFALVGLALAGLVLRRRRQ